MQTNTLKVSYLNELTEIQSWISQLVQNKILTIDQILGQISNKEQWNDLTNKISIYDFEQIKKIRKQVKELIVQIEIIIKSKIEKGENIIIDNNFKDYLSEMLEIFEEIENI